MEYTYFEVAEAKDKADDKINNIVKPILEDFDAETKKIANKFDKVAYRFNNENEKMELIKKFEDVKKERDNSKYSKYICLKYEIDDEYFYVDCNIYKMRFGYDQRVKIAKTITIEL